RIKMRANGWSAMRQFLPTMDEVMPTNAIISVCPWTILQEIGSCVQKSQTAGKILRHNLLQEETRLCDQSTFDGEWLKEFQPDNYNLFQETRLRSRTQGVDEPNVRDYYEIFILHRLVDQNM
ncbi:hypothetical protein OUZ56_030060, partial [Daphnia magna]